MSGEWIQHDGMGCPLPIGTKIKARLRDARVLDCIVRPDDPRVDSWFENNLLVFSGWAWNVNGRPEQIDFCDVVAYRVIDRFREQRQAMFERLLNVPAPEVEPA